MSFLYPLLLLTGLAAALPILLHLIRRREVQRLTFPAIRYLRMAEQRYARRLRLRHLALLAARVVLILLLAVAAAGPLVGRGGAADHRPTAVALVVDWSLSSAWPAGDQTLLDAFIARAMVTLDLATGDDHVALFGAVDPGEAALAVGPTAVREYLTELRPAAAVADLPGALREAAAWLASQEPLAGEIHILTDLQAASATVENADTSDPALRSRGLTVIGFAPQLEGRSNGTPAEPVPEEEPLTAGRRTAVSVPLSFFGPEVPPDPAVVRLLIGDDVVAVG
ncbi:MAG: VWA domain-containing protein, partial [Gemmatimonadota bacterium]